MSKVFSQVYGEGHGQIVEKKSRFLGDAFYISCEEDAAKIVEGIKKTHYDARHHCFAYVLDEGKSRYSDDGEPQGTAGMPILDVINGRSLLNTLVVVTRYFGGILLGTGGLTRAYSQAAKAALEEAVIVERQRGVRCDLSLNYELYGKMENMIASTGVVVEDSKFEEIVRMSLIVPEDEVGSIQKKITTISAGKTELITGDSILYGNVDGKAVVL